MVNACNRDLMTKLYRWMERHEIPKSMQPDEASQYFQSAWAELDDILQEHSGTPWGMRLVIGFYEALEDAYKENSQNV